MRDHHAVAEQACEGGHDLLDTGEELGRERPPEGEGLPEERGDGEGNDELDERSQ